MISPADRAPASLPAVDVRRLARDERADFAAFLATLPSPQWQAPTLCTGWRVRDVVAHVISYDNLDPRSLLALAMRGRCRLAHINAAALARYDTASPPQWLALLTDHPQPRGVPAALGGRVGLVEALIHHQDVRRAPLEESQCVTAAFSRLRRRSTRRSDSAVIHGSRRRGNSTDCLAQDLPGRTYASALLLLASAAPCARFAVR